MNKRLVSIFTLVAVVASLFGTFTTVFANKEVITEVVYDFSDDEIFMSSSFDGLSTSKAPQIKEDDVVIQTAPIAFRNYSNTSAAVVDGRTVIKYARPADGTKNTYVRWFGKSDLTAVNTGRLVFSGKYYSTTENVLGLFTIERKGANECETTVWKANAGPKANTWYDYKFVVDLDLDKNNVIYTFTESNPKSSAEPHVISKVDTYKGDSFVNIWADIDIQSTDTTDFCAYTDFKLTYNNHSKIYVETNGNSTNGTTFDKGIIEAETSGSGVFAMALYKDGELVSLKAVENEEELELVKLSMVADDMENTEIKIYRFDMDGTPVCVNKIMTPGQKDYRVFFNETFDNGSNYLGTSSVTSDGQIKITGKSGSENGTRYGGISAYYPDRHFVVEADYAIDEDAECIDNVYLLSIYTTSPVGIVRMTSGGLYADTGHTGKVKIMEDEEFEAKDKVNIACVFDFEELNYDVYVDRVLKAENVSLAGVLNSSSKYNSLTFYALYMKKSITSSPYTMYLDNYKAYSGSEFIDIGNDIPTAHRNDFKNSPLWTSDIFERPEAYEIAKSALETGHPRLLVNSDKVKEIKNSTDARVVKWRGELMTRAEALLSTEPFTYAMSSTNSIQNLPESMALMMDLGMAYLLTGDTKYSDRAYKEAEVLYTVPFVRYNGDEIPEETRDYWNSYSYLDVAEISYILGLCYDWMYDAWTPEQIEELTQNVMEKGIMRHYKIYFGEILSNINTAGGSPGHFKGGGNWNGVCNGGSLLSAIAFMEQDVYTCASVAEVAIRSFEYMLKTFYPDGAWFEGAGYWNYNLQYFTAACATLDAACGTDFGLNKAPGLKGSQLYSISLEGKTGVTNFGDGGSARVNAPFLFYWANKYKDTDIGGAALYMKDVFGYNASCYDLVYYKPDYVVENWLPPLSFYYAGTEVVSFTAGRDENDTYIAISGGPGKETNHDHLDSGGVVLEMKGHRLFNDLGAEHYGAAGYFSTNRFLYFRARPEGHSTFVIDPMCTSDANGNVYYGQVVSAVSKITSYDPVNQKATMDLSDAYARDASKASRTISLDGNTAIIEDAITLKDTKDIYWNWYIKTYDSDAKKTIATIDISEDGKSAKVTRGDAIYDISFETNCDYTLEVQAADYYVNVDPDVGGRKHKNTDMKRLVLKLTAASGSVNVKTIVK